MRLSTGIPAGQLVSLTVDSIITPASSKETGSFVFETRGIDGTTTIDELSSGITFSMTPDVLSSVSIDQTGSKKVGEAT